MTDVFKHPAALVESEAIGDGTRIWAFAHVLAGAVIGRDCNIGDHVFIEGGARVGDGVTIKNNVLIWEGVTLGDYVFVGPAAVFTNDRRPRSPRMPAIKALNRTAADWLATTLVGEGASIGAGAVIVAGITLGAYSMVGAGSVVTRNVAPFQLVAGNPARPIGMVDHLGDRLREDGADWVHPEKGTRYRANERGWLVETDSP